MRRRPLAELWAWLIGLVLPFAGLAVATALAFGDVADPSGTTTTQQPSSAEVAGVRVAEASVPPAPTATPRDTLSTAFSPAPIVPQTSDAASAPAPPGAAVAGVQVQATVPIPSGQLTGQPSPPSPSLTAPQLSAPLLGRVGGHHFPAALPIVGLALALAGAALRGHTSAAWTSSSSPSRSATSTRRPSRSPFSSFHRT